MGNHYFNITPTHFNMKALGVFMVVFISAARSQYYYQPSYPSIARPERASPPAPSPSYPPAPLPYKPEPYASYPPASYAFDWNVFDTYTKNDYGHQETRNDKATTGSYHVALPDGRVQTVTYSVDGYGGYVADVSYAGEAAYPEAPAYPKPAPAYPPPSYPKPAPSYAPKPYVPAATVIKPVVVPEAKAAPVAAPEPVVKVAEPEPVQEAQPVVVTTSLPPRSYPVTPAPPAHPSPTIRRYNYKTLAPAKAIATTEAPAPAEEKPGSYYFRFY